MLRMLHVQKPFLQLNPWIPAFLLLIMGVLLLGLGCPMLRAAEEIHIPFNFRWGDSTRFVENTLTHAKAHIVGRQNKNGQKLLLVEGHPDPRLERSIFYFDRDALIEVELQYRDAAWDPAKVHAIFEQTRKNLDRKYGGGRSIIRKKESCDGTNETILGYQWIQPMTSLRVILFVAEKNPQVFEMLSYHYRGL